MFVCFFYVYLPRTRQRTCIEYMSDVNSSSNFNILRRICEKCGITDVEYFDPVLCDGVKNNDTFKYNCNILIFRHTIYY